MRDVNPHLWFSPEELELCRACGERSAVRLSAGDSVVCFACGHVADVDDEPTQPSGERQSNGG
jgi:hypothetical protein